MIVPSKSKGKRHATSNQVFGCGVCAGSIIGHLRPLQSTLALYSEDKASMSAGPLGTAARQRAGRRSLASRKALPESQNGRKTCLKSLPAEEDFTVIWAAIAGL